MNKDCIKIDDMFLQTVEIDSLHGAQGYVKAHFESANDAETKLKIKVPKTKKAQDVMYYLKNHEVEVYIVRKGSNMANLGMAIIKSSFEEGFTGADQYESLATEVREMIGARILTKVEPEPEFVIFSDSDAMLMRIDGKVVASCKDVFVYTRPDCGILFEAQNLGEPDENGMVHAQNDLNADYFKRRQFGLRSYNALYVRPATEDQHRAYLKMKYKYLKSLENETDNYK